MTLRWYVVTATDTIAELTGRVRLPIRDDGGIGVGGMAEEGAAGSYTVEVDDKTGSLHLLNHRRLYAIAEDAPAGHQRVGNWWISDLDVEQMDPFDGVARMWTLTVEDENSIIPRKIQNGVDAERPAETDVVRILDWLAQTTEFASVKDFLHFDSTNPVDLTAQNFTGQTNDAILQAAKDASGKNYFLWFNELAIAGVGITSSSVANPTVITMSAAHDLITGAEVTISGHSGSTPDINGVHTVTVIDATTFTIPVNVTVGGTGGTVIEPRYSLAYFDPNTYTDYASTIQLSNVASEIDGITTFAISDDTKLNRAGGRIASGAFASGPFGNVYVQDAAVAAAYVSRDLSVPAPNVTTLAAATTQVTRQLGEMDEPDDEVTTRIWVTEAQINAVMHGMTIPLHATHFPGFTSEVNFPTYQSSQLMRVTRREVHQVSPEMFEIALWMSPMRPPPGVPSFFTHVTLGGCEIGTWPLGSPPEGALLVGFLAQRDASAYDADIVPVGVLEAPGSGSCSANNIVGTEWTFIDNLSIGGASSARLTFAYRDAEASEPQVIQWAGQGIVALNGTARPRSHQVAIEGLSGAPTVTAKGTCSMGAVMTSPDITVPAAGWIFAGFAYRATFITGSLSARSPAVTMTRGMAFGGWPLDPYSVFSYLHVAAAGTYNIVIDHVGTVNTKIAAGWVMGFWPE